MATKPSDVSKKQTVEMEELHINATRAPGGGFSFQVYDASELFNRAIQLGNQGRCQDAVALYAKIEEEFSSSSYLSASLYNAGLCLQNSGKLAEAADYYRRLCEQLPQSVDVKDALFQLVNMSLRLQRWPEAFQSVEKLLARTDLEPVERLEALVQKTSALIELGRLDEAAAEARSAVSYYRTRPATQEIGNPFYAAQANYLLAETFRRLAGQQQFPNGDVEAQRQVLIHRAELVLEAQREYFNTIQFQNAHWAAASGYQIGRMYDDLWQAITTAPAPDNLSPEARDIYRTELAKLVEPLVRHAIRYWELTLMMIERTGTGEEWMERTRQDLNRARERLLAQPSRPGEQPPSPPPSAAEPPAQAPRDYPKADPPVAAPRDASP